MNAQISPYRLELLEVSKAFPGVQALDNVSLKVRPGEVHALVGENGAGKSTLMKILSGAYPRDKGHILLDGQEIEINNPRQALQQGIVTIYQESNLFFELNVAENIFMGRLPVAPKGWVQWSRLYKKTQSLLDELNTSFGPRAKVKNLSSAQRQMVEIAKALSISARVIVLDEPTSSLTDREVDVLFKIMRRLRDRGVSIIFITHRLSEVFTVADQVTVLRDGQWVSTDSVEEVKSEEVLVVRMVGRQVDSIYMRGGGNIAQTVLRVQNLSSERFNEVSFDLNSGEIVGMFGLVGSGRTDVVRALFGAEKIRSGSIELEGRVIHLTMPRDSIKAGIVLVPEDRKGEGLVLGLSVRGNVALPNYKKLARLGFVMDQRETKLAQHYKEALDIRCPSVATMTQSLSGGNQQKVVIAKWLEQKPKVLIVDEPTRGIDVAGKVEVHRLMTELARGGTAVLMVSSELPEILGMSDRVLVMYEGRLVADIPQSQATEEVVMRYATGQTNGKEKFQRSA